MAFKEISAAPSYLEQNSGANTGWLFYRNYYNRKTGAIGSKNSALENQPIRHIPNLDGNTVNRVFRLQTNYPGLLIGSGYLHEDKKQDEAIKIGFYFDHATGLPVIPGSSVKGALRSAFPQFSEVEANVLFKQQEEKDPEKIKKIKKIKESDEMYLKKERALLIHVLLTGAKKDELSTSELKAVHELELDLFAGRIPGSSKEKEGDNFRSVYQRDLFFDAVPVAIPIANHGTAKRLFGTDYLTPHKHKSNPELDPFADPVPLKFFKVMPGVIYEFRFRLQDTQNNSLQLTASQKEELFRKLLLINGLGAKTNVGYGHFTDRPLSTSPATSAYHSTESSGRKQKGSGKSTPSAPATPPKPQFVLKHVDKIRRGDTVKGKLLKFDGGMAVFQLELDGFDKEVKTRNPRLGTDKIGKTFLMTITNKGGKKGKWQLNISFKSIAPIN